MRDIALEIGLGVAVITLIVAVAAKFV